MNNIKYNIYINQLALTEISPKLDIFDAALLDFLYFFCNSVNPNIEAKRVRNKEGVWTWVDFGTILDQMPILHFKSKGSISPRIKKLEENGYIKTTKKRILGHINLFIQVNRKMDSLFIQVNRPVQLDEQGIKKPIQLAEPIITTNTIHNTTKNILTPTEDAHDLEKEINRVIGLFSELDKDWKSFFKPGVQRTSVKKLIGFAKEDGLDVRKLIQMAKDSRDVEYAPQIFTPADMVSKYSKLIALQNKKTEKPKFGSTVPYTKGKYSEDDSLDVNIK